MEIVTENATSLAWMGDALMTCHMREWLLKRGFRRADDLQKKSARLLSAAAQSDMLRVLEGEGWFTPEEKEILSRGKAARIHTKAKNADYRTYLRATALEAVLGYQYLYGHQDRLEATLVRLQKIGEQFL